MYRQNKDEGLRLYLSKSILLQYFFYIHNFAYLCIMKNELINKLNKERVAKLTTREGRNNLCYAIKSTENKLSDFTVKHSKKGLLSL